MRRTARYNVLNHLGAISSFAVRPDRPGWPGCWAPMSSVWSLALSERYNRRCRDVSDVSPCATRPRGRASLRDQRVSLCVSGRSRDSAQCLPCWVWWALLQSCLQGGEGGVRAQHTVYSHVSMEGRIPTLQVSLLGLQGPYCHPCPGAAAGAGWSGALDEPPGKLDGTGSATHLSNLGSTPGPIRRLGPACRDTGAFDCGDLPPPRASVRG